MMVTFLADYTIRQEDFAWYFDKTGRLMNAYLLIQPFHLSIDSGI
jgi:hypothetical protein